MFTGVYEKLERAEYFLNNLKNLSRDAGGFPYIKKTQEMRANLDGFFFELISAKDFFLQGMNDHYGLGLRRQEATDIVQLRRHLETKGELKALEVVTLIEKQLRTKNTWLWQLNNYRNSATHRELLHIWNDAIFTATTNNKLFDKLKSGDVVMKPIFAGQENTIPPGIPRVDIPYENVKTYLFKDPEDPSQGKADIEVLLYCEQSLKHMRSFLENLYVKLSFR